MLKARGLRGFAEAAPASVPMPTSIRLDDDVRAVLEAEARSRGVGLATLLREIAADAARDIRRRRVREQSKAVAEYVASSPEAAEFYADWGTPRAEGT